MKETTLDVWKIFGDRLRRFIAKRVRNEHDADDVLQEVFAKIQTGLGGVTREEKIEPWLFQVTRRAVIDHFRKRSRPVELRFEPAEEAPSSDVSREIASWLTPMMELLDEPDRDALRLADLEGLGHQEIADRLGLSLTAAKSRVRRARRRLKDLLLECCQIEMDRRGNALSYTPRGASCSDSCGCD